MTAKKLINRFCAILIGTASLATAQIDFDIIVVEPVDPFIPDIPPIQFDFDYGDAPDPSYPTLHINDGARHLVIALPDGFVLKLGPNIDTELDGQPTALASGDDSMGPHDDEDGVIFLNPLQPGLPAEIEVEASGDGQLDAWADFNLNGSWMDPGEQIFVSEPLAPGINLLNFAVPATAVVGDTFIRFRFSSHGGLAPIGTAQDGEVEDYIVKIEDDPNPNPNDETDWGDAPLNYPVLAAANGAHHFLTNDLMLGTTVDSEGNGQPSANATRDDVDSAIDDEDGIIFTSSISPGANATIEAVSTMPGRLDAWIDFNQDGDWNDPGEQVFASEPVVGGPNNLNFLVPNSASTGGTFARFRLSSGGALSPEGGASDGEVEDYRIGIEQGSPNGELDWGDAPDKPYPTLAANKGAVHLIANGVFLGFRIDPEADGQPDPLALGDDNDGSDDDDGVSFVSSMQQGNTAYIRILASTKGYINAWIDFDLSGSWDAGEQIILNSVVGPGPNLFSFAVPSSSVVGRTAARIRFNSTGGLGPTGFAPDGEVEDYVVRIEKNPNGGDVDWGDARDPSFPTLAANSGASHLIDDLFLGRLVDPEPDGQPSAWALGDDSDGSDDEDGIIFLTPIISGSMAFIRVLPTMTGILDARIDFDGDGTWMQPNNRIFNNETVNPGQVLAFKVPKVKKPLKATGRFRLSHGGSDYKGHEIGGEVEDYLLRICKLIGWELNPDLLHDQIEVIWTGERGMTYDVQSSMIPQEWIRENLGEEEVARADDLFPTGLAWASELGDQDHEPHFVPHFPDWGGSNSTGLEDREALAGANRVLSFVNNTGQDANDLHVELIQASTPVLGNNSYGAFPNQSGGGSTRIDFDGGTVNAGAATSIRFSSASPQITVKKWWWTLNGRQIGRRNTSRDLQVQNIRQIQIARSKKVVLFRVIAAPE